MVDRYLSYLYSHLYCVVDRYLSYLYSHLYCVVDRYLSYLYSHPDFPKRTPGELQEELKSSVDSSPFWLLGPQSMYRYIKRILEKRRQGQPVSFTDFFGHLVGETLLRGVSVAERRAGYWAVQRSWFARVNALCDLSRKESRKVVAATSGPISE